MSQHTPKTRELKLMLHSSKFKGGKNSRDGATSSFWAALDALLSDIGFQFVENAKAETEERTVKFYDMATKRLRGETEYVFRDRRDVDDGDQKLTLKFRHADLVDVQKHIPAEMPKKAKLEEDVKPPRKTLFSYSENIKNKEEDDGDRRETERARDRCRDEDRRSS